MVILFKAYFYNFIQFFKCQQLFVLKVVAGVYTPIKKVGWSGVTSTLATFYGDVVMGILLSLVEAAILYEAFKISPL
jgi:hypothetical protein